MAGRKKQQGSGGAAAAASPAKEGRKGKEDGKEREKEKQRPRGKKEAREADKAPAPAPAKVAQKGKEVREDGMGPSKGKQKRKGEEKVVREGSKESAKEKQKQKGKEKEEEVREDGKEKEKEKEKQEAAVAKRIGEQFFKIFFSDQSGERLKIPTAFHKHLKEQPTGLVSLKGPSGNVWQAVLTSDSEGLCFGRGWKEFVMDHSVQQGHFLVFTYDGLSRFSVTVFGSFGVADPPSLVAKPSNDVVVKIEDDEEVQGDMDEGGTSEASIVPREEDNVITGKRTRGVDDLLADGNPSKRHSSAAKKAEKKKPEAVVPTSKDASTIIKTGKGAAWLSSARVVRCLVKSYNERNPRFVLLRHAPKEKSPRRYELSSLGSNINEWAFQTNRKYSNKKQEKKEQNDKIKLEQKEKQKEQRERMKQEKKELKEKIKLELKEKQKELKEKRKLEQKELKEKRKLEQKEKRNKKQKDQYKKDHKLQVNDQVNKDLDIAHNKKMENLGVKKIANKKVYSPATKDIIRNKYEIDSKKSHKKKPIGDKEKCSRLGLVLNKLKDRVRSILFGNLE